MNTQRLKMKEHLYKSASELRQPPASAAEEFSQKLDQFVVKGNQIISEQHDFEKLVGSKNIYTAETNNHNFARFMNSLFSNYNSEVFVETVLWVFRTYRSHGFQTTYWAVNLDIWINMIRADLSSESFKALHPFYNWLITNIPVFAKLTDDDINIKVQ